MYSITLLSSFLSGWCNSDEISTLFGKASCSWRR